MLFSTFITALAATAVDAHVLLSYPGSRGNNLIMNDTFPYGMQWEYPCGGISTTKNRTYWPTTGGAVAFQPGWFQGHATAFIYINIGFGTDGPDNGPLNMSSPLLPPLQLLGPSKNPYPGTVCFPQLPMPKNIPDVKPGDFATIQVIELAVHGAALYSCVDIEFAEPGDSKIAEVNETNCFNSSELGFADIYTITTEEPITDDGNTTSGANPMAFWYFGQRERTNFALALAGWLPAVLGGLWLFL